MKTYHPGLHDKIVGEKKREIQANVSFLTVNGITMPVSWELLRSISLLLIPIVKNGKYGFINNRGEIIVDCLYDEIKGTFLNEENIVAVRINKKWSVIDSNGTELLDFKYSHIWPSKDSTLATLQTYNACEVVDTFTNETIINSGKYDYIEGFRFGFARVKNNGKWGVVNSKGKQVLAPKYADLMDFYNNWDKPETKLRENSDSEWLVINLNELK